VRKRSPACIVAASMLVMWLGWGYAADVAKLPPKVVDTTTKNGESNVDPSLAMVSVTFSKPMQDKSWSWSYEDKSTFPQLAGEPYFVPDGKTICVLPVKLEPNKQYVIWINTAKHKNL